MHAPLSILPMSVEGLGFAARGETLLADIGFTVGRGRCVVVLGPNGAGKSLLLRLCHGLLQPTAGRVSFAAAAAGRPPRHAMVFQRPVMLRRSALANLRHALALGGVPFRDRGRRAADALARFGLAPLADRPARLLSGGEQQRLAIARATVLRPELLFLDEPTAALDPSATRAVEAAIRSLHAEGVTLVMATHDLGQARRIADEVVFLHAGRLREHAPADAFFAGPRSAEAAAFLKGELLW